MFLFLLGFVINKNVIFILMLCHILYINRINKVVLNWGCSNCVISILFCYYLGCKFCLYSEVFIEKYFLCKRVKFSNILILRVYEIK